MVEIQADGHGERPGHEVSVLYREPMWLKFVAAWAPTRGAAVSVLYREPMWLKCDTQSQSPWLVRVSFSALP